MWFNLNTNFWKHCSAALSLGALFAQAVPVQAKGSEQSHILDRTVHMFAPPAQSAGKGWEQLASRDRFTPMVVLLGAGSSCVFLTYDANGNRQAQTITTISTTGATWGASSFGCFIWK